MAKEAEKRDKKIEEVKQQSGPDEVGPGMNTNTNQLDKATEDLGVVQNIDLNTLNNPQIYNEVNLDEPQEVPETETPMNYI